MYQTKKISDVPMLSSANVKLYHKCGHMGLRGGIKAGANCLWEMRQTILSMGPEWTAVGGTLALTATNPNKGFCI
jgi:hypothetical protein